MAFEQEVNALRLWRAERGYSRKTLKRAYNRTMSQSREALLFTQEEKSNTSMVKLITRYTQQHTVMYKLFQKHCGFYAWTQNCAPYLNLSLTSCIDRLCH